MGSVCLEKPKLITIRTVLENNTNLQPLGRLRMRSVDVVDKYMEKLERRLGADRDGCLTESMTAWSVIETVTYISRKIIESKC